MLVGSREGQPRRDIQDLDDITVNRTTHVTAAPNQTTGFRFARVDPMPDQARPDPEDPPTTTPASESTNALPPGHRLPGSFSMSPRRASSTAFGTFTPLLARGSGVLFTWLINTALDDSPANGGSPQSIS